MPRPGLPTRHCRQAGCEGSGRGTSSRGPRSESGQTPRARGRRETSFHEPETLRTRCSLNGGRRRPGPGSAPGGRHGPLRGPSRILRGQPRCRRRPDPSALPRAQWTYLDPAWTDASGGLPVHLSQEIDTFDAVARYTFTLWRPGYAERAPGPGFFFPSIDGYVGGGAGVATVWERRSAGAFGYPPFGWYGFTMKTTGEFTGELAAGIQISLGLRGPA